MLGLLAYNGKWIHQFSDKIQRLKQVTKFPLNEAALTDFNRLKKEIEKATLRSIDKKKLAIHSRV